MKPKGREPIGPGSLVRIVGDLETFQDEWFRTAPAFVRLDWPAPPDDNPFLSDQVHIPVGETALVVGSKWLKDDDWGLIVLYDGLLLTSFYTYTTHTMREVFEILSPFDQCIG